LNVLIGIDNSHVEKGNLETTFKSLPKLLEKENFKFKSISEFPIKFDNIRKFKILVIAQPSNYLSENEINDIVKFVEIGNGLLILGDAGGDKAHRSNLNALTENFGIKFNEDKVEDNRNFFGEEDIVIIRELKMHPIFNQNIKEIIYPKGCSLEITTQSLAKIIAWTSKYAHPSHKAVLATAHRKFGRIVISGSYSQFRYDIKGGIESEYNKNLLVNIFNWLTAKEKTTEVEPPKIKFEIPAILKKSQVETKKVSEVIEKIPNDDVSIQAQIKSVIEIIETLKGSQKDLDTYKLLKKRFEFLIKMISKRLNLQLPSTFEQKIAQESTNIAVFDKKINELELKKESSVNLKEYIQKQFNLKIISEAEFKSKMEDVIKKIKELDDDIDLLKSKLRIVKEM